MSSALCTLQRTDQEQFLFETTVEASVRETVAAIAEIHNLRAKIAVLKVEGEELAKYGPAKPMDKQASVQMPLCLSPYAVSRCANHAHAHCALVLCCNPHGWLHKHLIASLQGIDEYAEEPSSIPKGPHYLMDPTGRRTGGGEA